MKIITRLCSWLLLCLLVCSSAWAQEQELPPLIYVPLQGEELPPDPTQARLNLDYARWLEVMRELEQLRQPSRPPRPPLEAALETLQLRGQVQGDSAQLTLTGRIRALKHDWSRVNLPAAWHLGTFNVDDERVALQATAGALQVHLPEAGSYTFEGALAATVSSAEGARSLQLDLPGQGATQLTVELPVAAAELSIEPSLPLQQEASDYGTRVIVNAGNASSLTLRWQAPAPAVQGEALLVGQLHQHILVDQRRLQWQLLGEVDILRHSIQQLRLQLPDQAQVLQVKNDQVHSWQVEDGVLQLNLREPVQGKLQLGLVLERALPELAVGDEGSLSLEWLQLPGAVRIAGSLALTSAPGMALQVVDAAGLTQINPEESLLGRGGQAQVAYRLHGAAPQQQLQISRLAPELSVDIQQLARLGVEEDLISSQLSVEVRGSGVFRLSLRVPAGWRWLEQQGLQVDEVRQRDGEDGWQYFDVELRNRLLGPGSLKVQFAAPGSLLAGQALPMLQFPAAQRSSGALLVAAPPSWALASGELTGMVPASLSKLQAHPSMRPLLRQLDHENVASLGFARRDKNAQVQLSASPRPRELRVQQELRQVVGAGGSRSEVRWHGEVRYRAVETLHIDAPSNLDSLLRWSGANLAESRLMETADGRSRWRLRFQSPQLGRLDIQASWSQTREQSLAPGQEQELLLPALQMVEATRERAAVALVREDDLELSIVEILGSGLTTAPLGDLPPALQGSGVTLALLGNEPTPLRLRLLRHDVLPLAEASISMASYRGELAEDGRLRVRAQVALHSRDRPWLLLDLPKDARLLEVSVDGRSGRPSRRDDGSLVIPLGDQHGDRQLAFFYEQQLPAGLGWWGRSVLTLPQFAGDGRHPLPVERSALELYLPPSLQVLGSGPDFDHAASTTALSSVLWGRSAQPRALPATADVTGLGMRLDPQGQRQVFWRADDGGTLQLGYVRRGLLNLAAVLLAVGGAVALALLRGHRQAFTGISVAAVLLLLVLPGPWWLLALAFACGWFACLVALQTASVVTRWWRWRRARTLAQPLPVPWEEDGDSTEVEPQ